VPSLAILVSAVLVLFAYRITDADDHYTDTTPVGTSNNVSHKLRL